MRVAGAALTWPSIPASARRGALIRPLPRPAHRRGSCSVARSAADRRGSSSVARSARLPAAPGDLVVGRNAAQLLDLRRVRILCEPTEPRSCPSRQRRGLAPLPPSLVVRASQAVAGPACLAPSESVRAKPPLS